MSARDAEILRSIHATTGASALKWTLFLALVAITYAAFFFGLVLTIARIDGEFVGEGSLHIEKSTLQSLQHFYEEGVYLPFVLILVFSVIFPVYKLCLILAILSAKNRRSLHKAIEWSTHLRQTAKFQFLDIFVAIFMRAFLNQEVIHTELKDGFFVYLIFCVLSLITAEVLTVLVDPSHLYDDASRIANVNSFDRIMFLMSAGGVLLGLAWSMFTSILIVKVALRGSLTVSQASLSLTDILIQLLFRSVNRDPVTGKDDRWAVDAITGGAVVVVLGLAVPLLFVAVKIFNVSFSKRKIVGMLVHDWSLGDVMALGLFTTLVSMNSFENLSAEPAEGLLSGFYFFLMYGLSCFDITTSVQKHGEGTRGGRRESQSSDIRLQNLHAYHQLPLLIEDEQQEVTGSIRSKLVSKLSGSFLLMKAVGWGVFFFIWFSQAHWTPIDLDRINTALRANLGIINSALESSLPRTVGNCTDSGAITLTPCSGTEPLYYNKDRYEVEARWVTGVNSAHIDAIVLSAPIKDKLALSINGALASIPMSLSIGECFTPDVYITGKCDKIWDNVGDSCCGSNKGFAITVIADCFEDFPFVRNITINRVKIDPILIQVSIVGFKVSLQDVTDKITNALSNVLEPYVSTEPFINWGQHEPPLTLADLVNKIISLNAGGMSAEGKFKCPDPIISFP